VSLLAECLLVRMALLCKRTRDSRHQPLHIPHTLLTQLLSSRGNDTLLALPPSLSISLSQQDGGAHVGFLTSDYKFEIKDLSSASYTLEVSQTVAHACAAVITLARQAAGQHSACRASLLVYRLAHFQRSNVRRFRTVI
jgi:hypothetical protein